MPRKQISKARVDTLLDLSARMFTLAHSALQMANVPQPMITTGLAAQAQASGVSKEDFDTIVYAAARHAREFEAAAREAGVIK
jgi:hypothetical protein